MNNWEIAGLIVSSLSGLSMAILMYLYIIVTTEFHDNTLYKFLYFVREKLSDDIITMLLVGILVINAISLLAEVILVMPYQSMFFKVYFICGVILFIILMARLLTTAIIRMMFPVRGKEES